MIPLGRGRRGDAGPPNVNLDPPNISETTRARTLKLKTPLDMVKVLALGTFFSAIGRPGGGRAPKTITRFGYKMFSVRKK